jgi:hypothetical protein
MLPSFVAAGIFAATSLSGGALPRAFEALPETDHSFVAGDARFFELVDGPVTPRVTLASAQGSQITAVILNVVLVDNGNPATNTGDAPGSGAAATPCPYDAGCDALDAGLYDFEAPQEFQSACDADPNACSEELKIDLGACDADSGGCDYDTWQRTLEGGCDQLGPDSLPGGGCDLASPASNATPSDSALDDIADLGSFNIRYQYGGDSQWLRYGPGSDGKLYVLDSNESANPFNFYQLERLFQRYPQDASLTIVQNGREYTVVKTPEDTIQDSFRAPFIVHHPDGFTFPSGPGYAVVVGWINTIGDGDYDLDYGTYLVRALPDGRYRVVGVYDGTTVHDSPTKLANLFSQLPASVTSITLIENDTEYQVARPPGIAGTTAGDALAAAATGLLSEGGYRRTGPRAVTIADTSGGPKIGDNAFLERLFRETPDAEALTVTENGRTYLVTALGPEATVGGRPARFLVTHPDGFNFVTGPNRNWDGLGPRDIYTGRGARSSFVVRPRADGKYVVVTNDSGAPLSGNAGAVSTIFSRVPDTVSSIVLVEGGSEATVTRPGALAGSFEVSHSRHARREYVRFAPGDDGKLIVVEDGQVNYSWAAQSSFILRPLFERFPGRDTLTIVQDGSEYVVVKAPPGAQTADGLNVEFVIHHPDGYTYPAGAGYVAGSGSPLDIHEPYADEDSSYSVRPLPDGTYRVLYNYLGGPLSADPDALKRIFSQVPTGTDSITLVEGGRSVTVNRPPGTPGTDPGTTALDTLGAALGGNTTIDFRKGGGSTATATAEINGPGAVTVTNNNLQTGRPAASDAGFLDSVFARFPGANSVTVIEVGRSYFVTRTPGDLHVNGVRVPYIINHADGFNFTAGPNHTWNGLAPGGAPSNSPIAAPGASRPSAPATSGNESTSVVIPPAGGRPRTIVEQPDGTYVLEVDGGATPDSSYSITVDTDALGNRIFHLPGETYVDAAPGVEVVNIADNSDEFALTPEAIQAILRDAANGVDTSAASLAVFAVGQNISTGDGAFDLSFLNNGKPRLLQGDVAVLRPTEEPEAPEALRAFARHMLSPSGPRSLLAVATPMTLRPLLAERPPGGGSQASAWADLLAEARQLFPEQVTTLMAAGYCLQKDMALPRLGQIYTLADTATQRLFDPAREIITAAARVQARGELNPDSDPAGYFHATRQWAVWTHEKGYDEAALTAAFLQQAEENFVAGGQTWTEQAEDVVRELMPNRYNDILRVLAEAGLAPR